MANNFARGRCSRPSHVQKDTLQTHNSECFISERVVERSTDGTDAMSHESAHRPLVARYSITLQYKMREYLIKMCAR